MSITSVFDFTSALSYTQVNTQITGNVGKLGIIPNPGQIFAQNFNDDTGFTYDAAKAEFTGGLVRQKDQRAANTVLGATYTSSKNLNWSTSGSLVATDIGTPTLVGGKLSCIGGGNNAVRYENADIGASGNVGAMRIKYTPNYSGSPTNNTTIFQFAPVAGVNDLMLLFHSATGTLRLTAYTSVGTLKHSAVVFNASAWVPVAGTEYELELNWDTVAGVVRLFIDGVLWGSMPVSSYARGSDADRLYIGAGTIYAVADASFNDALLFSTVQHTAGYTPGYSINETIYAASTVALPNFSYTGLGGVQSIDNASTVEVGTPRYIVGGKYWNGSAWVASNGTYAQANSLATALANFTSFNTGGGTTLPVSLLFTDSNSLSSVDDFSVEVTGQKYSPTGKITTNQSLNVQEILSFAANISIPTNTLLKFLLNINGQDKYWNGSAWVNSDGTIAQSNTYTEINTNIATLELTLNSNVKLVINMSTITNTDTPTITDMTLVYDFGGIDPAVAVCTVWGYYKDLAGIPVEGATVTISLSRTKNTYQEAASNIVDKPVVLITDVNGYFESDLIRSSEFEGTGGTYAIKIEKKAAKIKTSKNSAGLPITFEVPDAEEMNITDLLTA